MFGGELCELAFGRGYGAAALYTHAPRGLVGVAFGGGEGHAHPALLLSAAQYAGRVGGLHLLCLVGDELEVVGRYALHVVETGCTVVKCQTDGVEYGALARAYIACYGKEAGRAQGFFGKIDGLFSLNRRQIAESYLVYLHKCESLVKFGGIKRWGCGPMILCL